MLYNFIIQKLQQPANKITPSITKTLHQNQQQTASNSPMGNTHQQSKNSAVIKQHKSHIVLQMRTQQIIIHHAFKMRLRLSDVETFPHGLDGLKIWEAGIVLARYVILNCAVFKNKEVLELGSGVGVAGIAIKKWTQCKSIQMSDYNPQVVQTIKANLLKNTQKVPTFSFDWRQRDKLIKTYDLIVGSDIVYFGCPVKDLYLVFEQKLRIGGKGIIIIPQRKNYAELFLNEVDKDLFDWEWQELNDQVYKESPLDDQKQAKFDFGLLWEVGFRALVLTRKEGKGKNIEGRIDKEVSSAKQ